MVKRLLADTFFLHLHRKSSSCSSCSTTQTSASPGQAANATEMTLLTPGSAPGHLLMATSAAPGPPQEERELRSSRLHRRFPWPRASQFSRGAGREPLPHRSRLPTCFPPAHAQAPSHPQPAHSLGTHVGVLPPQHIWPHKQLQRPHYVRGMLQGQRRGQGTSGLSVRQLPRRWPRETTQSVSTGPQTTPMP